MSRVQKTRSAALPSGNKRVSSASAYFAIEEVYTVPEGSVQGNGMDIESRTCKYFALKRTRSKYFAGRVVKYFALLSLPHSGIEIFCSLCLGLVQYFTLSEAGYLFFCYRHIKCRQL